MKNEPVIAGFTIPAIVAAVIAVLTSFDLWHPTVEQISAVTALAVMVASVVSAWMVRRQVTPNSRVPLPPPKP